MIGDNRNSGILRWKAARIVQHAWSRLYCSLYGHLYRPSYTQRGSMAQYRCECCGELTPWMNKKEFHEFNRTICPTWGERGEDSQGYRKMCKLHRPPNERTIGEPEGGWKTGVYAVYVALKKSKDIHNAVLYVSFLDEDDGISYATVWIPQLQRVFHLRDIHYLEVVIHNPELSEFL